jgi:hypothetical protein
MAIDYATYYSALYDRVAVDSDGAAARALLGVNGLFMFHELGNLAGRTLRYLVWQPGSTGNAGQDIFGTWTAYDAPNRGPYDLHRIMAALHTLYGHDKRFAIAGGEIVVNGPGQVFYDDKLSLNGQQFVVSFLTIG